MRWLGGMIAGVVLGLGLGTGVLAGAGDAAWDSKALLLDAPAGDSKPVPVDGTVTWKTGTDAKGGATLIGTAQFPARTLGMTVTIAANPDKSVPASHLVDLRFEVGAQFGGASIVDLAAIALKNDEMGQGTQLVGASVRVADNSFLFALSATAADLAKNMALLGDRDFIDLGIVDDKGRRTVVTLGLGEARAAFAEFAAAGLK